MEREEEGGETLLWKEEKTSGKIKRQDSKSRRLWKLPRQLRTRKSRGHLVSSRAARRGATHGDLRGDSVPVTRGACFASSCVRTYRSHVGHQHARAEVDLPTREECLCSHTTEPSDQPTDRENSVTVSASENGWSRRRAGKAPGLRDDGRNRGFASATWWCVVSIRCSARNTAQQTSRGRVRTSRRDSFAKGRCDLALSRD